MYACEERMWGGRIDKENGASCSPEGKCGTESFVLRFYLFLAGGITGQVSGEGFYRIVIDSPGVPF